VRPCRNLNASCNGVLLVVQAQAKTICAAPQDVCTAFDPDSKSHVTVRDDMTMHILYATGDEVITFADEARLTKWTDGNWRLELEGLPCVQGSSSGFHCQISTSTELRWTARDCAVHLRQDSGHFATITGCMTVCGTLRTVLTVLVPHL
jgi:hypothetical protein